MAKLGTSQETTYAFSNIFLQLICLFSVFGIISLIIKEERFLKLIAKLKLTPRLSLVILIITIFMASIDRLYLAIIRKLIKTELLKYEVWRTFTWFEYLFPLIFIVGFVWIYRRYYKQTQNN